MHAILYPPCLHVPSTHLECCKALGCSQLPVGLTCQLCRHPDHGVGRVLSNKLLLRPAMTTHSTHVSTAHHNTRVSTQCTCVSTQTKHVCQHTNQACVSAHKPSMCVTGLQQQTAPAASNDNTRHACEHTTAHVSAHKARWGTVATGWDGSSSANCSCRHRSAYTACMSARVSTQIMHGC
jgi:hypothetical protein